MSKIGAKTSKKLLPLKGFRCVLALDHEYILIKIIMGEKLWKNRGHMYKNKCDQAVNELSMPERDAITLKYDIRIIGFVISCIVMKS